MVVDILEDGLVPGSSESPNAELSFDTTTSNVRKRVVDSLGDVEDSGNETGILDNTAE